MQSDSKTQPAKRWLVPALLVIVALLLIVIIVVLLKPGGEAGNPVETPPDVTVEDGSTPKIGYAQGVTVVDDESALQDAVDKMFEDAKNEMVASYKNQAVSEDGKTFSCYIANSEYNEYDMYISLYTDQRMEGDPIYLSGLMRPGEAFKEITLDKTLGKGSHTVYLVFTQVEDDHATMHGQSVVTIQMEVN